MAAGARIERKVRYSYGTGDGFSLTGEAVTVSVECRETDEERGLHDDC